MLKYYINYFYFCDAFNLYLFMARTNVKTTLTPKVKATTVPKKKSVGKSGADLQKNVK
jgi:hypothetical protein